MTEPSAELREGLASIIDCELEHPVIDALAHFIAAREQALQKEIEELKQITQFIYGRENILLAREQRVRELEKRYREYGSDPEIRLDARNMYAELADEIGAALDGKP